MKIAIDISSADEKKAGIGYYTFELARALVNADNDNHYFLYTNKKLLEHSDLESDNAEVIEIKSDSPNLKWIWKTVRDIKQKKIDWLISPSVFTFGVLFPNTIQIIHDLIPLKYPEFWPKKAILMFKSQLKLESKRARFFATNSETTKKDLIKFFPKLEDKSFVIGTGLHDWAMKEIPSEALNEVKTRLNLPGKYILSTSTLQPRKNYENMILAFKESGLIKEGYKYVIVGKKGWFFDSIFDLVKNEKLEKDVIFLGYVDEADLPVIYKLSKLLIYCSFDEGFGLPAIEAYSQNVPSVLSDIEVMRETMKEKALYADPNDFKDIATKINESIKLEFKKDSDFLDSYNWKKVAKNVTNLYRKG